MKDPNSNVIRVINTEGPNVGMSKTVVDDRNAQRNSISMQEYANMQFYQQQSATKEKQPQISTTPSIQIIENNASALDMI